MTNKNSEKKVNKKNKKEVNEQVNNYLFKGKAYIPILNGRSRKHPTHSES